METEKNFTLIKGTFNPDQAADVLFKLINDKITYHQLLLFSHEERFGADVNNSRTRIAELTDMKSRLEEAILEAQEKGYQLSIQSDIRITKAEPVSVHS